MRRPPRLLGKILLIAALGGLILGSLSHPHQAQPEPIVFGFPADTPGVPTSPPPESLTDSGQETASTDEVAQPQPVVIEDEQLLSIAVKPTPRPPLLIPVQGIDVNALIDTFTASRNDGRIHNAIDILAPTGTPVLAAADGRIAKLFESDAGGLTIYQFDTDGKHAYYYAHLDDYADGVRQGMLLKRGQIIGYVGYSGNADSDAPHLHFAIFELGPAKRWWKGTAINPYPLLMENALEPELAE